MPAFSRLPADFCDLSLIFPFRQVNTAMPALFFRLSPLALACAATLTLTACNSNDSNSTPTTTPAAISFTEISPATSDAEKRMVRSTPAVTVNNTTAQLGFTTLLRSGEQRGSDANLNVYGQIVDNAMKPILNADNSKVIADSNDFTSLLKVGSKLFSVAQMESQPGGMYLTEVSQNSSTGKLQALTTKAIDLSSINGIWNPCAGMVTPWNTHLGSEEYEPDAKGGAASASPMAKFFGGGTTVGGDASQAKPYFYGFPVEVAVTSEAGATTVSKHYSMGRFAHELSYVMPDKKTVYQSDDGTNVGLYMYTANTAGNLSAGSLYAAKWTQTSAAGSSDLVNADISWIKLGTATDAEIKTLIDGGITFSDIFDITAPAGDFTCAAGYTSVNANGVGEECLKLKPGMEKAAAFLETRRYAGYLGATTEFRKEEGITFDPAGKRLYVAYSELVYGMEDNKKLNVANTSYDRGTSNQVKALFNYCGAVYGFDTGTDATIGSDYVLKKASGIIAGKMTTLKDSSKANPSTIDKYDASSPYAGSTCSQDAIANPDNITFIPGQKTLLIGEDSTDGHQNDMVWSYNVETKKLTRIFTTPYGAETTSLFYYPDLGGFSYIMTVIQHPYGESDETAVSPTSGERRSYMGVIGTLPAQK